MIEVVIGYKDKEDMVIFKFTNIYDAVEFYESCIKHKDKEHNVTMTVSVCNEYITEEELPF